MSVSGPAGPYQGGICVTKFYHFNFNVLDLDRSLAFYKQALNLTPVREKEGADGSFKLVYLLSLIHI